MPDNMLPYELATHIIQNAGGTLVGRTRLQKIAFLMQLAGFENNFTFEYRHYGPYSETLAQAMELAVSLESVSEQIKLADWGGHYSIYTTPPHPSVQTKCAVFIQKAKDIDAVELELAATAAFLFEIEGIGKNNDENPWKETERRKPSKAADGRLEKAFKAYEELRTIETDTPLPQLPPILRL